MTDISKYCLLTILCIVVFPCKFLSAQPEQTNQSSGSSLWLESKEIDLGVIPPEQNTIVGAIHFMNEGAQSLEIRKVVFEP